MMAKSCLLYTSDAADDTPCVDLGDDLLEEDDEDDNVPLEEIADMPSEDDS